MASTGRTAGENHIGTEPDDGAPDRPRNRPRVAPAAPSTSRSASVPATANGLALWGRALKTSGTRLGSTPGTLRDGRETTYDARTLPRLADLRPGTLVTLPIPGGGILSGRVDLVNRASGGATRIIGSLTGGQSGRFALGDGGGRLLGNILLPSQRRAYVISEPHAGSLVVKERRLSEVICYPLPRENAATQLSVLAPEASPAPVPILDSRPGATDVLYLDFDGATVTGSIWNDASHPTITASAYNLTAAQITEIWNRVKEDYWPFNIDVTTDANRYANTPVGRRMRVR